MTETTTQLPPTRRRGPDLKPRPPRSGKATKKKVGGKNHIGDRAVIKDPKPSSQNPQDSTPPVIPAEAPEDLILADQPDALERSLSRFLPGLASRVRDNLVSMVRQTADGRTFRVAAEVSGVSWRDISRYRQLSPQGFAPLWSEARRLGEEVRRQERDDEAHDRATAGGSDRLLELLHKEDHPEHYQQETAPTGTGGGISYTFVIAPPAESGTQTAPQKPIIDI